MIKYLIVQLSSLSTSFCHYKVADEDGETISLDNLKEALKFSMKENLMLQVCYPPARLPEEIDNLLSAHPHVSIASYDSYYSKKADVIVFDSVKEFERFDLDDNAISILLLPATHLNALCDIDETSLYRAGRLNIIIQEFETISQQVIEQYKSILEIFSKKLEAIYRRRGTTQVNLLSDLLFTESMNNCNAGLDSISIAPNGRFYLCPAFYYNYPDFSIGSPKDGITICNQHLLRLDYAPICRKCDAFHCKRCIWLNKQLTGEINTPSREQCVIAHIERNESKNLLERLRVVDPNFANGRTIDDIDYLDPFELISR